jgi:acetoin utilization deacetylase AcuC-like enzyme
VRASTGGAVAAAINALRSGTNGGSLSNGLHHARRAHGNGFCTFNGLALAARAAIDAGAARVLILDVDAHMGGGTFSLVRGWPEVWHADIAVCPFMDRYETAGHHRATLDIVRRAGDYLPTLRRRLRELAGRGFELLIYNAGMDVHERCGIGGLAGMTRAVIAEREDTVAEWAHAHGIPLAFVLAGGYTGRNLARDELVALHGLTLTAAAGLPAWSLRRPKHARSP